MGTSRSKHQEPPLLVKPWRTIDWEDKKRALEFVNKYKLKIEGKQIRILLHGPKGAGKSSFINSVQSVLHGSMYTQALVSSHQQTFSFTKKYTTYKIQKGGPDHFYPFVFNDTMGLSQPGGVHVEDIKLAMMGHVKEGYKFNPESKLSEDDPNYVSAPNDNDRVQVLVCVIPANNLSIMPQETLQKIRDLRGAASDLGIPQVAILTKIDEAHPEIGENLRNVYKVPSMKQMMENFSVEVGIPMNCIFPVKNYHEEIHLNSDVDSLILSTLENLLHFGEDCINFPTV